MFFVVPVVLLQINQNVKQLHEITARSRVTTFFSILVLHIHVCMTFHEVLGLYSSVTLPLLLIITNIITLYYDKLLLTTATSPSTAAVHPFVSIARSYPSFEGSCTGISIIQHYLYILFNHVLEMSFIIFSPFQVLICRICPNCEIETFVQNHPRNVGVLIPSRALPGV